jgi:hypothetical protein
MILIERSRPERFPRMQELQTQIDDSSIGPIRPWPHPQLELVRGRTKIPDLHRKPPRIGPSHLDPEWNPSNLCSKEIMLVRCNQ